MKLYTVKSVSVPVVATARVDTPACALAGTEAVNDMA